MSETETMADVSDEELARLLEQHEDRPWHTWADIVTNGQVVMMVTELQARRAAEAKAVEALRDAVAHLAGAASAYREHASRHKSFGRAKPDTLYSTRLSDFDRAVKRGRAALGARDE